MTLAISIDTRHGGKPNFAMATITTIGDRTAVDFNYIRKPTVAEIACAEEAVTRFLKSNGEDITVTRTNGAKLCANFSVEVRGDRH